MIERDNIGIFYSKKKKRAICQFYSKIETDAWKNFLHLDVSKLEKFIDESGYSFEIELFPGVLLRVRIVAFAPSRLRASVARNIHFRQRGRSLRQRRIVL